MNLEKERELFELTEVFKDRCEGLVFNNGKYEFGKNIEGLSQIKMAILGLNLTVVNSTWHGWIASINRQGYVLAPVEPTSEMIDAGIRRQWDELSSPMECMHTLIYKAMLGAVE